MCVCLFVVVSCFGLGFQPWNPDLFHGNPVNKGAALTKAGWGPRAPMASPLLIQRSPEAPLWSTAWGLVKSTPQPHFQITELISREL